MTLTSRHEWVLVAIVKKQLFLVPLIASVLLVSAVAQTYQSITYPYNGFGSIFTATGISGTNIVGIYKDSNKFYHGFIYNGVNFTILDATDSSEVLATYATGISGTNIVGWYTAIGNENHGFIDNGKYFTKIDHPQAVHGTVLTGISGSTVIGHYLDINWSSHSFYYDGTNFSALNHPLGVRGTSETAISESNIVGTYTDSLGINHGFLYDGTNYRTIDASLSVSNGITTPTGISGSVIVGTYLVPVGSGSCTAYAFFYIEGVFYPMNYAPAAIDGQKVVGTFGIAVLPSPQNITFTNISKVSSVASPFAVAASASSGLPISFTSSDSTVASVTTNGAVTVHKAGTTLITASQSGNENWLPAPPVTQSLVVGNAQTITFLAIPLKTYGNAPFSLAATASSGLPVSYSSPSSIISISSNRVTILGAGTATITASQAGNSNYVSASPVTQMLTIAKAPASVVLSGLSQTYNGSGRQITFSTTPTNLAVTTTYNGSSNAPTNAGTYAVISSVVNPNYIGTKSGSLVIAKAGNLISFSPLASNTFGQTPYLLTNASASSGLPITYSSSAPGVARISGNTVTITGAGTAIITASQAGNSNYVTASSVTRTLTVAKAAQAVSFNPTTPVTFVKNGTFSLSASNTSGSPVTFTSGNTSILTISGKTATMKAKGSVSVTASAPATPNYNAASTNATITLQ